MFRTYRAIPRFIFVCFYDWFPSLVVFWFPLRFLWFPLRVLWFPSLDCWRILPPQEDPHFLEHIERFLVSCVFGTGFGRCFLMVSVTLFYGSKILKRIKRFLVFCCCVFRTGFRRCFLCYGFRYVFNGFCCWIVGGFCRRRRIHNCQNISSDSSFFVFLGLVPVAVFCFMVSVVAENVCYGFRRWLLNGFRRGKERYLWFPSLVFMVSGCYRTAAFSPMETVNKSIRTFP